MDQPIDKRSKAQKTDNYRVCIKYYNTSSTKMKFPKMTARWRLGGNRRPGNLIKVVIFVKIELSLLFKRKLRTKIV